MKLSCYLLSFRGQRGLADQNGIAKIGYFKFLLFGENVSSLEISMNNLRRIDRFVAIYDLADILDG